MEKGLLLLRALPAEAKEDALFKAPFFLLAPNTYLPFSTAHET